MQLADRYILGGADCRRDGPHGPTDYDAVVYYFLLDTTTGERGDYPRYEGLRDAAAKMRIQLSLKRIDDVYRRYRFTWFDGLAAIGMFGVPLLCGCLPFIWALRIRESRHLPPPPA